ncbi:EAL domain-containing protein [Shewanella sp. C32]|uniref:EAL domain-containing protein n=1 Tax=Shewanella electrica TaxID=515560 RepID=A0ABT2FJX5_9GAMM|nr:EAL domain-containing protein [Shewanella electrica]MCH1924922.1 EAL domain-containing protein [Shewanella electrica]MCS4556633.1 EAL domain-containing protein [Shewanella electrica]
MNVDWIAYIVVALGLMLLVRSLKPAALICKNDDAIGWKALITLLILFVIGYSLFFINLFYSKIDTSLQLISVMLLGGATFVAIIIPQAHKTILKIESIAATERQNSLTDSMTKLANRKSLLEHLSALSGGNKPFSLFFIDLNNFKQINDGLGHYYGDQFLIAVAKRLSTIIPDSARLFRIGGDEFAVVYREYREDKLIGLIDSLHTSLLAPIKVHTHSMKTSASIGIACYPKHSNEMFDLVKKADMAMYDCKSRQGNFTFYNDNIGMRAERKLALSQMLSDAVQKNQFSLFYQPIINAESGQTLYVEALLRWPQANGTVLMPEQFIPMAAKSTLINAITYWVVEQACTDLPRLRALGFNRRVHVNLTARDLQSDNLVQQLRVLKQQNKLQPQDLMFELTESDLVEDLSKAKRVMHKISRMGFEFCVDNFGTGFSSLVLLRELPISQIKIDRSFVNDFLVNEISRSIICHIIALAGDLNCSVIAEGVENELNAAELIRLGAELHQGWLYSEALPLDKLPAATPAANSESNLLVG